MDSIFLKPFHHVILSGYKIIATSFSPQIPDSFGFMGSMREMSLTSLFFILQM